MRREVAGVVDPDRACAFEAWRLPGHHHEHSVLARVIAGAILASFPAVGDQHAAEDFRSVLE
jgi:hypothetical protein